MSLNEASIGREYVIKNVMVNDSELISFLFTLGLYSGENVTVISKKRSSMVVSLKDSRYSIDKHLAGNIKV